MAQYRSEGEAFSKNLEEENDRLLRLIIEEETSAYILDKGGDIGIGHLEVSVSAKWSDDGYWYPSGVEIASNASESQKKELMRCIEAELGIPEEMQTWSTEDESK